MLSVATLFICCMPYICIGKVFNKSIDGIESQNDSLGICNGEDTLWSDYPYMASIRHTNSRGHCCGATILNMAKGLLLTAAHCQCSGTKIIYIGCDYRESVDCIPGETTQEYEISEFIQHPFYNEPTNRNRDVGIIRLTTQISRYKEPTRENMKEIILDSLDPINNEPLIVVGYGRIAGIDPDNKPKYLQYGNISTISRDICSDELPSGHSPITTAMICGRGFNEEIGYGITTCSGDSGGPWFSDTMNGVQVGITSWGYNNCANSNCQCCVGYPRMAANIADLSVYEWIRLQEEIAPIPPTP